VITCETGAKIFDIEGSSSVLYIMRDTTERKKREMELDKSYKVIKLLFDGIIHSMEKLVEKKDSYTVGHQKRTAELARAIAVEMGFDEDAAGGIYTAALIHDIGKIFISGTILTKPGALTAEEYNIIKKHPEMGADVIKDIEFPWPVWQMIYEHHERVDGSGYPRGIKGNKILPGAKIICVADVVEAMTFARPYRPGLGIDKALEEIKMNSGRLYDADVSSACLSIFEKGKFKFK
jgi:putative nucleotidyltransferase with HDIG domain